MIPISRIVSLSMAGVLCFGLLVPMSLARHLPGLAVFIGVLFVAYVAGNVILWQRTRSGR